MLFRGVTIFSDTSLEATLILLLVGDVSEAAATPLFSSLALLSSAFNDNFCTLSVATPKWLGEGISLIPPVTALDCCADDVTADELLNDAIL